MTYLPAAVAYYRAGWTPLPLPPKRKHSPPTGYTGRDGRRPDSVPDVYALADGHPDDANLCLRMPDTVIGLDVDAYDGKHGADTLTEAEKRWGPLPPTWRSSSRDDDPISGIRFYRVPAGYEAVGTLRFPELDLADIETVQWFDRYAVVAPSIHPDLDPDGRERRYRWHEPDGAVVTDDTLPDPATLPTLPTTWLGGLASVRQHAGATDPTILAALRRLPDDGPPTGATLTRLTTAITDLGNGSRHDSTRDNVLALYRLHEQGQGVGTATALADLCQRFVRTVTADGTRTPADAGREYVRFLDGAPRLIAATPTPDHHAENAALATLAGDRSPATVDDEQEFWERRDELTRIRDTAYNRGASPWAVFGGVLCRVIVTVPPYMVLPPVIYGRASVNLFCALVGPSGVGKGGSSAVAAELVPLRPEIGRGHAGSGEGLAHLFAHSEGKGATRVVVRDYDAVLVDIPELDTLRAIGTRSGATILPLLRMAFSGEDIGLSYVDPTRRLPLGDHGYRLTMIVGAQPTRADWLLDDADGGTPQRFLWLPATDPNIPDLDDADPVDPIPLDLYTSWPRRQPLTCITIPATAKRTIQQANRHRHAGKVDVLDGHALQVREKVAYALAILAKHGYEITDEDWELAGIVMRRSDATRAQMRHTIAKNATEARKAAGHADATQSDAKDTETERLRVGRTCTRLRTILTNSGWVKRKTLRLTLTPTQRPCLNLAIEHLLTVGAIEERLTKSANGAIGKEYRSTN
ncbi:bifunctional DNA primase/polymerase [Rhodococcus sp. ACS1]|uniref:bifunctional DNA primase/polymerase n=1 Tax=Rhodococcus sp. ACS1 TaxID=2028570 RepID=UPI00117B721F|nr:bifunctional DNA primase/polymerase [Rhodococcus sp. ACS1]